ncbi:MAG TPA: 50S ribosomal protein L25 [Bacteroidota bacterium]|nr:50S ribosomal protein L25 [Bacteroidota bacterium]
MSEIVLQAEVRAETGKRTKSIRKSGKIPGEYYSRGEQNIHLAAAPVGLKPLIYTSETHIINLKLSNGESKTCVLRNVQFDPVSDLPIHFDLQGVRADEELTIEVPVMLQGTPKGVKDGGTIQHVMHRLKVSCLPKFIPEHVEVHIDELGINQSIHVRDIKIDNVTILESASSTIVAVVPPTILKEEVPADAAAAATIAEPEVIAKGKKPEEGEEGEAAKPAAAGATKAAAGAGKAAAPAAKAAPAAPAKKDDKK